MSSHPDIDYKNKLFEHPELTRIIEKPTTATLITLQAEIRDNIQAAQYIFGGGAHGHLGLVCSPDAYQAPIPGVEPYCCPNNPGALNTLDVRSIQLQLA